MSELNDIIASDSLYGKRAGEDRFVISIEVGRPHKFGGTSPTEWVCPLRVDPFFSSGSKIHGEGSLQALCLAVEMVRFLLANFLEEGGDITLEGGEQFSLKTHWPKWDWS